MCELCRRNPCVGTCPNAPEPEPVYICCCCEEGIYDSDDYYVFADEIYCQDCVDRARQTAREPEYEFYEPDAMTVWKERVEAEMCERENAKLFGEC